MRVCHSKFGTFHEKTHKSPKNSNFQRDDIATFTNSKVMRQRTRWMKRSTPLGVTKKIQIKLVNPTFVTEQNKALIHR